MRRGYIAYELNSLQHRQLPDGTCVVEFQFMLPSSHPNRYAESGSGGRGVSGTEPAPPRPSGPGTLPEKLARECSFRLAEFAALGLAGDPVGTTLLCVLHSFTHSFIRLFIRSFGHLLSS